MSYEIIIQLTENQLNWVNQNTKLDTCDNEMYICANQIDYSDKIDYSNIDDSLNERDYIKEVFNEFPVLVNDYVSFMIDLDESENPSSENENMTESEFLNWSNSELLNSNI